MGVGREVRIFRRICSRSTVDRLQAIDLRRHGTNLQWKSVRGRWSQIASSNKRPATAYPSFIRELMPWLLGRRTYSDRPGHSFHSDGSHTLHRATLGPLARGNVRRVVGQPYLRL